MNTKGLWTALTPEEKHLLKAAPALLEACRALLDLVDVYQNNTTLEGLKSPNVCERMAARARTDTIRDARLAVAQAEGKE